LLSSLAALLASAGFHLDEALLEALISGAAPLQGAKFDLTFRFLYFTI
jgi:hypothetical protein